MAPMPTLQRRYSVTGQTPPDNEVPKQQQQQQQHSPKLRALDTNLHCGLCDPDQDDGKAAVHFEDTMGAPVADRGRKMSNQTMGRASSKRSATQLPSPSTPTSHELPPKIAKLGLEPPEDMDTAMHVDMDEGVFTDLFLDTEKLQTQDLFYDQLAFAPSSPSAVSSALSDGPIIEPFDQYDSGVESLALTPIATRSTPPFAPVDVHIPTTLLTCPPEIRRQIYLRLPDLVLPYPLIYCLSTFNNKVSHPLASVNRLIRAEALAIFYSYNTWTIKLEFKMMYEAFQDWIIRLGDGAGMLRLVTVAVRGKLFKPRTSHANIVAAGPPANGQVAMVPGMPPYALVVEQYSPPDGDASFSIDLSEKYDGGKVVLTRNEGTKEAGDEALRWLQKKVAVLWEKRQLGTLNGQDWVTFVDELLAFAGWW